MSGTETGIIKREYDTSVDGYLTEVCLDRSMGDVVRGREQANNTKAFLVNCMVFNAVFEQDIDLIKTIATRIDGTVPSEEERGGYANILGDAIEDVLQYEQPEMLSVTACDTPVIAIAKVLVYTAARPAGNNVQQRKSRNLAAQMILERTGGRKVEPTRPQLETRYVEPKWMSAGEQEETC